MSGIIDSFFVALGYKIDPAGLDAFQKKAESAKESILSFGNALKVLATGAIVRGVAHLGSQFEQNQIQIAGFLSALGQSPNFDAGLQDAAEVIRQITNDAAKLPGEAEDYIDVFKGGLPFVQGAMPGGSLQEMTSFTNKLTAIGKTFGLDAGLIAREFDHMLSPGRGTAGLRLPLFRQLLPFMHKIKGQAHLTAESFNAMTEQKRLQLLQSTFAILQPMLDASALSFDAMAGAAISMVKQVGRMATVPLFKGMKQALDAINSAIFTSDGKLTELGRTIVDGSKAVADFAVNLVKSGVQIVSAFTKVLGSVVNLRTFLKPLLVLVGALVFGKAATAAFKLAGALGRLILSVNGLKRALMGGLVLAIALLVEDLYQFYNGGESVVGLLVKKWAPAIYLVEAALALLVAALLRTQIIALATGVRMALAWLIGLGPISLLLIGIAALILAAHLLADSWDEVFERLARGWERLKGIAKSIPKNLMQSLGIGVDEGQKEEDAAVQRAIEAAKAKEGPLTLKRRQEIAQGVRDDFEHIRSAGLTAPAPGGMNRYDPNAAESMQPMTGADALVSTVDRSSSSSVRSETNVNMSPGAIVVNGAGDSDRAARKTVREITRLGQNRKAY